MLRYSQAYIEKYKVMEIHKAAAEFMSKMFNNCSELEILDLSNFNTENVIEMGIMFDTCTKLKTIYTSHDWNTGKVRFHFSLLCRSSCSLVLWLLTYVLPRLIRDPPYMTVSKCADTFSLILFWNVCGTIPQFL